MLHLQENVGLQVEADDFSEVMSEGLNEPLEQLAQTMADNIGLALANLKLRETLRGQAIRDALTGLFNRRYLEETLDREMQRVRRRGGKLGLMMLDLDFFKQFNDTYGHEAGDALLSSLGNLLRTRIRAEDIACRYGGEEFILILPEITLETLLKRAEAIRQGVANLQVHYRGQVLGNISISVGVALFPDHGDNRDDLLLAVDAALYQAKKQGRNTVVVAGGNQEATEPDVAAVG
jgi:diguanylate cyclase (GGDEF)-like protein